MDEHEESSRSSSGSSGSAEDGDQTLHDCDVSSEPETVSSEHDQGAQNSPDTSLKKKKTRRGKRAGAKRRERHEQRLRLRQLQREEAAARRLVGGTPPLTYPQGPHVQTQQTFIPATTTISGQMQYLGLPPPPPPPPSRSIQPLSAGPSTDRALNFTFPAQATHSVHMTPTPLGILDPALGASSAIKYGREIVSQGHGMVFSGTPLPRMPDAHVHYSQASGVQAHAPLYNSSGLLAAQGAFASLPAPAPGTLGYAPTPLDQAELALLQEQLFLQEQLRQLYGTR